MSHDPATLAFYAREAAAYAARAQKEKTSLALTNFLARLPPGAHILDLGCGGGQHALAIKIAGFKVTAMDGCSELAREAEARLGQPVCAQLFEDLSDENAFDAVWANASLLHVPRPGLPDIFARIRRALKPAGIFYASFKSGGVEGRDGLGRYYNHPSKDDLIAALPSTGWSIVEIAEGEGAGYDGVVTGWLALTVQKKLTLSHD